VCIFCPIVVAVHHYLAVLSVHHGAVARAADDEFPHDANFEEARVHDDVGGARELRGDGERIAGKHLASVLMKSTVEQKAVVVGPACFAYILGIRLPVLRENLLMDNLGILICAFVHSGMTRSVWMIHLELGRARPSDLHWGDL